MFLEASSIVTAGFIILPLLAAAGLVLGCECASQTLGEGEVVRRRRTVILAVAVLAWLLATALLAASGVLRIDARPPPLALLSLAAVIIGIVVPFSSLGTLLIRGLPLWALVGFQVFRLPLELVIHQAYVEGVIPAQMSYPGLNYDILSGITAGMLGLWLVRGQVPRWVVVAWNALGSVLLLNIVALAILSTPRFQWFGADHLNVFVTYPPFVWLPTILVVAALMGHVLVWRWLALTSGSSRRVEARS